MKHGNLRLDASPRRSGFAMVMVVVLLAVVTLMSVAMLGSSVMRAQASDNAADSARALGFAESGVNLAMYYLKNPQLAPTLNSSGYWPGQSGIDFGLGGTTDVVVTRVSANVYDITATGQSTSGLERQVQAQVRVNMGFQSKHAGGFRMGSTSIAAGTTIAGPMQADGMVTVTMGGRIEGFLTVPVTPFNFGGFIWSWILLPGAPPIVPTAAQLNDLRTYVYDGKTYEAVKLTSSNLTKNINPTPDNPAGVYWTDGSISLPAGDVFVNGTIVVTNGGNFSAQSGRNYITPKHGFPALVVTGNVHMSNATQLLEANGVVWIGGSITRGGTSNAAGFTINGSLLMAGTTASIGANQNGWLRVNYSPANAYAPGLSGAVAQGPDTLTVLQWQSR